MSRRSPLTAVLALVGASLVSVLGAACQSNANAGGAPQVVLETSKGTIVIELLADKAPASTQNFLGYVDRKFYDGLVFHRVIPGFMIQGGGYKPDLTTVSPGSPVKNESNNGERNLRGTVAMARTSSPDSATSQFYINVVDNPPLDAQAQRPGYTVFGKVVSGMDVVDKIAGVRTCPHRDGGPCHERLPPGMRDVPAEAVVITKAFRK